MSDSAPSTNPNPIYTSFLGAIAFYSAIPLPPRWPLALDRIARWCPWVGLMLGGLLISLDLCLSLIKIPAPVKSALVIGTWVLLTGGLHLDGAIDAADGLAVPDRERRLAVMKDSVVGAYGTMAAVGVLGLKTLALTALTEQYRWLALAIVPVLGRWGQLLAIAAYPYLRPDGKGRFHREALRLPWDLLVGTLPLGAIALCSLLLPALWPYWLGLLAGGGAIAWSVGAWFQWQLGGQTGDTYGAIVEWTEALSLCLLTAGIIQRGAGG
ncbi:MAG: adenosylcobinamide-GDP ribazoletransferase [Cyanobacteria bacterium J06641_5]